MNLGRAEHPFHAAAPKPARPNSSPGKSVGPFRVSAQTHDAQLSLDWHREEAYTLLVREL